MKTFPTLDDARANGFRYYRPSAEGIIMRRELSHGVFEIAIVPYKPDPQK